jgi:hypothetical protein
MEISARFSRNCHMYVVKTKLYYIVALSDGQEPHFGSAYIANFQSDISYILLTVNSRIKVQQHDTTLPNMDF